MSNKKYKYGFKKIKREREKKIESLIQFEHDALDKFVTIHKNDIWISRIDEKIIEQLLIDDAKRVTLEDSARKKG